MIANNLYTIDDIKRKKKIITAINKFKHSKVLDIGCGSGFITEAINTDFVMGIDADPIVIKQLSRTNQNKHTYVMGDFTIADVFKDFPTFDMIVMTGILYRQYIENKESIVLTNVDKVLEHNGYLILCHIENWAYIKFPYKLVEWDLFDYGKYYQKIEVYQKIC